MALRGRVSRIVLAAVAIAVIVVVLAFRSHDPQVKYAAVPADRGDIMDVVGATGTVQAVQTVQVGSQVSGTIESLSADFNSVVRKGQVIARLDPSLFQARVGQAQANLISARANVDRSKAAVDDARSKLERAKLLAAEQLLPQSDLDTAQTTYDQAVAQLRASQAAVSQAQASVNQAQVDLQHTIIAAPIDGVVVARNVDVGQTVAASFTAPVLFTIANDLKHMEVNASVDEADIGRVRSGQEVTFRVDAYPDRIFPGRVGQVRLQPTTVQNVVTYNTIITVDNDDGRLLPGMTATVSVIVRKSEDALRIPAAALRFRPEGFEPGNRGGRAAGAAAPGAAAARGSGARADGARRGGPRAESVEAGAGGGDGRPALVFILNDRGQPEPARVRVGVSDGQYVEVQDGLPEGARVIVGIEAEGVRTPAARPSGSPSNNPFNPPRFQRRQR